MKNPTRTLFTFLRLAVGLLLVVLLARSGAIDWAALARLASDWRLVAASFSLFTLAMLLQAWRACVLLRAQGFEMSLWASFKLSTIGLLFSSVLPGATGGDGVRIYYAASGNTGRRTEVATVLLLDRAVGMLSLLLLPLPFLVLAPELIKQKVIVGLVAAAAVMASAILLGGLVLFSSRVLNSRPITWLRGQKFGRPIAIIFDTIHAYRRAGSALFAALGLSVFAQLIVVGILLLFARTLAPGAGYLKMAALIPLGLTANGLPVTPGGLGVGEAAFNQLFGLAGLTGGAELLLGWRMLSLIGGLVGLVFFVQGKRRFVHSRPAASNPALEGALEA